MRVFWRLNLQFLFLQNYSFHFWKTKWWCFWELMNTPRPAVNMSRQDRDVWRTICPIKSLVIQHQRPFIPSEVISYSMIRYSADVWRLDILPTRTRYPSSQCSGTVSLCLKELFSVRSSQANTWYGSSYMLSVLWDLSGLSEEEGRMFNVRRRNSDNEYKYSVSGLATGAGGTWGHLLWW